MGTKYKNPRIGINSLAQYTGGATATRRSSIIKNAKDNPLFIIRRYNEAEEFLAHFLASGASSQMLNDHITTLKTSYYFKDSDKENAAHSADVLHAFYKNGLWLSGLLSSYTIDVTVHENAHKTIVEGVQVSLRPELMLSDKQSGERVGFVKFYFSKTRPLPSNQAELIACFGKYYFESEHTLVFKANNCFVLDVFSGAMTQAPKAFTKRLLDIQASCKEIADRWDLVV